MSIFVIYFRFRMPLEKKLFFFFSLRSTMYIHGHVRPSWSAHATTRTNTDKLFHRDIYVIHRLGGTDWEKLCLRS